MTKFDWVSPSGHSAPVEARAPGLVDAAWLAAELRGPAPPVVMHVSWGPFAKADDFIAGHIPGALHLDTDDLEDGYPTWKLRPLADLQAVLGGLGVTPASRVVVYGPQFIAVARAWWVLLFAGAAEVHILDGGFRAWIAAGGRSEGGPGSPRPPVVFAAPGRSELLATTEDVRKAIGPRAVTVADVRSAAEFRGEVSGYDYLDARGRIPGSIHLGDADDGAGRYVGADGGVRDLHAVVEGWQEAGVGGAPPAFDRDVIFACGSGWRSSAAFFAAWCAGYRNIQNYSDGWCGWSTRYVRDPAATGGTPGWRQEPTGNACESG